MLKCAGSTWLGGTAWHCISSSATPKSGGFISGPVVQYPVLVNLMTYGGLLIEFGMAFFLWFRATRRWAILGGLSLHLGILITVNIPIFGELMTACYLTFLTAGELDSLLRALDPRTWLSPLCRRREPAIIPGRVDGPAVLNGPHAPSDPWDESEDARFRNCSLLTIEESRDISLVTRCRRRRFSPSKLRVSPVGCVSDAVPLRP